MQANCHFERGLALKICDAQQHKKTPGSVNCRALLFESLRFRLLPDSPA
jgi:hypothetical protein